MPLNILDNSLNHIRKNMEFYSFPRLVRACRDTLGMKRTKTAELAGITIIKLKQMERGYLLSMLADDDIRAITNLFDLPFNEVKNKMIECVGNIRTKRKIEVICEKHDEEEEMP